MSWHRVRALFRVLLFIAASAGVAREAAADQIWLKNGDSLNGTVLSLTQGVLRFESTYGSLSVLWSDVVALQVDSPMVVNPGGRETLTVPQLRLFNGAVTGAPGVLLPADAVVALARPDRLQFTGTFNAGFLATSGNSDVSSVRFDGELGLRSRRNRYTLTGVINRAHDTSGETARNATTSARYDRFFTPRFYANATALFTTDRFRDLDLRSALGTALGYQMAEARLARFGAEAGYGFVQEQFAGGADEGFHAFRETVNMELLIAGPRLVLFHRHDGFFGIAGSEQLFVQTRNGVRVGLMGNLVMTMQYELDYDPSPSPGRRSTDHSTGVTFGYRFQR